MSRLLRRHGFLLALAALVAAMYAGISQTVTQAVAAVLLAAFTVQTVREMATARTRQQHLLNAGFVALIAAGVAAMILDADWLIYTVTTSLLVVFSGLLIWLKLTARRHAVS